VVKEKRNTGNGAVRERGRGEEKRRRRGIEGSEGG